DALGADALAHGDAGPGHLVTDERGELRLEWRQDVRGEFDHVDLETLHMECLGGFDPDESGTEHDGALRAGLDALAEGDGVADGAEGAHAGRVEPWQRGTHGAGAGGEYEGVVV